jgi:NAD(P)-dependent dehydrogenase (short-subunit alcohol dehydrogenase family)
LSPKVALVTGGRRGIGRATAVSLANKGLRVVVSSRQPSQVVDSRLYPVQMDLSDRRSIDAALAAITEEVGPVDTLVNNAQAGSQVPIRDIDFDAFETMLNGEVINTVYLTREVLEAAGEATVTVVNVGSAAAEHVPPVPVGQGGWAFSYAASKAALHRLTPFLQLEYGDRVRAFTVNPGFVRTEALLERLGDVPGSAPPELPASVIAWLATDPEADAHKGSYIHAQEIARQIGGS